MPRKSLADAFRERLAEMWPQVYETQAAFAAAVGRDKSQATRWLKHGAGIDLALLEAMGRALHRRFDIVELPRDAPSVGDLSPERQALLRELLAALPTMTELDVTAMRRTLQLLDIEAKSRRARQ